MYEDNSNQKFKSNFYIICIFAYISLVYINHICCFIQPVAEEQKKVLVPLAAGTLKTPKKDRSKVEKTDLSNFGQQTENLLNMTVERCYFMTIKQWVLKILDENTFVTVSKFWISAQRFQWNFKMGVTSSWKMRSPRHFPRCFLIYSAMRFLMYFPRYSLWAPQTILRGVF